MIESNKNWYKRISRFFLIFDVELLISIHLIYSVVFIIVIKAKMNEK